jgi:outer membrane lipoprotein SlyB
MYRRIGNSDWPICGMAQDRSAFMQNGPHQVWKDFTMNIQVKHVRGFALAASAVALVGLTGCATQQRSASVYRAGETQREQIIRMATVESVRDVQVERGSTGVGTGAGAVIGGVAGSSVGGGRGSVIAAVAGAVAGGVIGQAIEGKNNLKPGIEITVKLENGELRAIVQEVDEQQFRPGDKVRLVTQGGVTRVSR